MPHKCEGDRAKRQRKAAGGGGLAHKTKASTGMNHEIEVCDEHRKDIDEVLQAIDSFTGHARRIGPNAAQRRGQQQQAAPAKAGRSRGNTDYDTKAVRQWAAANGIEVSERGRISTMVLEHYRAALSHKVRLIVRPLDDRGSPDDVKDPVLAKMFLELTYNLDSEVAVGSSDQALLLLLLRLRCHRVAGRPAAVDEAPPRRPDVVDVHTSPLPDPEVIRNFDWDKVNLDATAIKLRDLRKNGVPAAIRYTYKDEVLAVFGLDIALMEGALRNPDRVEIRPESFNRDKRYPVLGFYRGDITVILGLRQPVTPKVIAAYATSLLQHDTHRVGHTGSGGSKRSVSGLPFDLRQVAIDLRAPGAQVESKPTTEAGSKPLRQRGRASPKDPGGTAGEQTALPSVMAPTACTARGALEQQTGQGWRQW